MTDMRLTVDYDFYWNLYGGLLPEMTFNQAVGRAGETILALLSPRTPADLTDVERECARLAVCAQVEAGLDRPVTYENAGEFKTQLADGMLRIHGIPVSAGAAAYLRQAGLLEMWL